MKTNNLSVAVTGLHPCKLADEILKVLGDADDSTARVALEIAGLLFRHRQIAQAEFLSETSRS